MSSRKSPLNRKLLSLRHWARVYLFLGPRSSALLIMGAIAGIALFAVELGFAYAIQAFLVKVGAMSEEVSKLPRWLPISSLTSTLIFLLVLGVMRGALQWAQAYMAGASSETFRYFQRTRLLKWAFHGESASANDIIVLFTERCSTGGAAILSIQTLTVQLVALGFLGISLLWFAPSLTLLIGITLFALGLALRRTDARIKAAAEGLVSEWDNTNHRLMISIKNLLLMQIYGTQAREEAEAQKSLAAYFNHAMVNQYLTGLKLGMTQILGVLMICCITLATKATNALEPGSLISYFYLFVRFMQTVALISVALANFTQYWPQLRALANWWANEFEKNLEVEGLSENSPPSFERFDEPVGWHVANLDFSYPDTTNALFSKFNVTIAPGKVLVITGPSGVGKSTLIGLLLGNISPDSGSLEVITAAGRIEPLENVRERLLHSIGYVGAESFLIEGTIRTNLAYGLKHTPGDEEIAQALRQAECHFVFDLPAGLAHQLSEQGQGLSAGQKQRLSLARALLRKPKVLILDEATANLDSRTEDKLVNTFKTLKNQMTIVAVTHRKALLEIADQQLAFADKEENRI